ncbi:hypothetical protein [Pseudoalteromonas galatheae]|uniref:hypothetical protein n=1 Tax=Pseudoalteromonas galatheae TaxID=579562 RepID=UPI0030CEA4E4
MSGHIYNDDNTIRTSSDVEILYQCVTGFIGRLSSVEYKQSDGSWKEQGSRWLVNEDDPVSIMNNGNKPASL